MDRGRTGAIAATPFAPPPAAPAAPGDRPTQPPVPPVSPLPPLPPPLIADAAPPPASGVDELALQDRITLLDGAGG